MENVQGKYEHSRGESRVRRQLKRSSVRPQDVEDFNHDVIVRAAERIDQLRKRTAFPGWLRAIENDLSRRYWPPYIKPSKPSEQEAPPPPKQIGTEWIAIDGTRHEVRVFEPAPRLEEPPRRQLRFVELSDSSILKASISNRLNYPRSIDIREALGKLPARWATAIRLVYFDGYSRAEAAAILGCRKARLFKLLQKSKCRLRTLLPGYARNGKVMRIFTIGFTKKSAEQFFSKLRNSGAKRLVDVRLNNVSQLAGFAKKNDLQFFLREICGMEYVHVPALAPTQEMLDRSKKKKGEWSVYEREFLDLMKSREIEKTVSRDILIEGCLLCSEDKPDHCHRRLVAEYLKQQWGDVEIVHLT